MTPEQKQLFKKAYGSIATHTIEYSKPEGMIQSQHACGKTDLFKCLRSMMKDGYTDFTIKTIK